MEGTGNLKDKESKLQAWLKTKLPEAKDLSISPLQRAGGGFANENYFFDLRYRENGKEKIQKLVLRWPPQHTPVIPGLDLLKQFEIVESLQGSSVPVPKTYWMEEDPAILGSPFFIVEFVEGEAPSNHPPSYHAQGILFEASPERRGRMWKGLVEAMAKLHALDWQRLGLSFMGAPEDGTDALERRIAYYQTWVDWGGRDEPLPVLRAALDWLRANKFEPKRLSLCWGDPAPYNIIYRDDKVAALLDWDFAFIGPPEFDLAYAFFTDSACAATNRVPRLEGFPGMEETVKYYEELTGRKVENFLYHQVLAAVGLAAGIVVVYKIVTDAGAGATFPPEFLTDNWAMQKLGELLGR